MEVMSENEDKERKSLEGKICSVCGDQALGYNFNAVTCESCKAFFRRNAMKELRCPFKNTCTITSVTRRFCQKCRLTKCFEVGMKRELIMTEADKERKKRKILENKAKLASTLGKTPDISEPAGNSKSVQTGVTTVEIGIQTDSSCSCYQYKANVPVYSPLVAASPPPEMAQYNVVQGPFAITPPTPFTSPYPQSQLPLRPIAMGFIPMQPSERELLEDLIIANRALDAPVDHEMSSLPGEDLKSYSSKSLLDVINLTALAIRRLIKMCKRISRFKFLCQEDQLTLLKQGCTQMMILRSVMTFDPDKNSWRIPHTVDTLSQIKVEVLKEARGNLYDAHEAFLRTFDNRVSHDINVVCIMTACALFDPNRTNLVNRPLIARYQQLYFSLLQSYLQSVFTYAESNEIYHHLLWKMSELHLLVEEHVRVYLNVNPTQVEPLLKEIFDLKPL